MSKSEKLILIGGGGHCFSCIDVIESEGRFEIAGIIDSAEKKDQKVLGYPVIGSDEDLNHLVKEYQNFFITIGQIKSASKRMEIYGLLKKLGANIPVILSPRAYVSKHAKIGNGTIVMANAFVNAGVEIGVNCIVNTGSIIEHNSQIGDHCHISTASVVNGNCMIGKEVFIGSNTALFNNINITDGAVIGAGSVVTDNITEPGVYAGSPVGKIA